MFKGYAADLDFKPGIELKTLSVKKGRRDFIVPYERGNADSTDTTHPTTTAEASVTIPATQKFQKAYSGKVDFSSFYSVNMREKADTGYSENFGNKAYRSFHGQDANHRWDMVLYVPETAISQELQNFPGLALLQADWMDQGYFHITLTCGSRLSN